MPRNIIIIFCVNNVISGKNEKDNYPKHIKEIPLHKTINNKTHTLQKKNKKKTSINSALNMHFYINNAVAST